MSEFMEDDSLWLPIWNNDTGDDDRGCFNDHSLGKGLNFTVLWF
jgi:hypothetical protein